MYVCKLQHKIANNMTKFNLFIISVLATILFSVDTGFAQTAEKANIQMIIANKDSVFYFQDDVVRVEFKIKGLYSSENVKPYVEQAALFDDIVKLRIKDVSDIDGYRKCVAVVKKDNYKKSFSKVLSLMRIKEVLFEDKKISSNDFLEMYK